MYVNFLGVILSQITQLVPIDFIFLTKDYNYYGEISLTKHTKH